MIARQVKPEEVKRTEELFSISFDSPYDNPLSPEELYHQYSTAPKTLEQEHSLERFAAFEDDNKTMMSCFIMQPFSVRFDGHYESMYSIGGVATLPQYRKRGGIRACFEKTLSYLYEKETAFSYLYPFSTAYYRKFGYELCCRRQHYSVALSHIPAFSLTGSSYLVDYSTANRAAEDIPRIYSAWQDKYNMMVRGTAYDFSFIGSANPYKDQVFTYVYRSAENEPLAYMTFSDNTDPNCRQLVCSRFFYINAEGLQGLLALAKGFASDYRQILFSLPMELSLEQTLPEWSMGAIGCTLYQNGMVRVIHVKKVLQNARYIGSGSVSIQIDDPFIPENNRTFQVVFSNGVCREINDFEGTADISMPINVFSTFITGGYDTDSITDFSNVSVHASMEEIRKVFYKKPVYITNSF